MNNSLLDKIEEIRLREVSEGRLYDCPNKEYAEKIDDLCGGFRVGVRGVGLSSICHGCKNLKLFY
ncbi:hypothetical protein HZA33_03860 [Candidatus Pacearchaeota archaeon]|nr:hypothetical protein [Candidatus Pacearchaeota archaeon]